MVKPEIKSFFDSITATWTYVIWEKDSDNKKCAIIDSVLDYDIFSGRTSTISADKVISFIKEKNLEVVWILETHVHADHLTAASYIKEKLGGKTAISKHITEVLKTWESILHNENDTPLSGEQFDHLFEDNEEFLIGNIKAQIIHTPGHTPADSTFLIGNAVFVGDAIFLPDIGTGRCDFPGGSAEDSFNSIQKIFALNDNYNMYVGHDYPPKNKRGPECTVTISEQKNTNIMITADTDKDTFIEKRNASDQKKDPPKLLFPSIQVNLRAGSFGETTKETQFIKIPVNKI